MSEILASLPDAILTCFIYERLQKKSIDDAYKSICRNLKLKDNFRSKFLNSRNLIIQKDKIGYCTIYEFLQKKPLGQAYKSICDVIGSDVITYEEMKSQFENFKNGKIDADLEVLSNNFEKKITINEPSEVLRTIVNNNKPKFNSIRVCSKSDHIRVHYDHHLAVYTHKLNPKSVTSCCRSFKTCDSPDFMRIFFDDLKFIFDNSTHCLNEFVFNFGVDEQFKRGKAGFQIPMDAYKNIEILLKSLNHLVPIKYLSLRVDRPDDILAILPYLKPKILEKIEIDAADDVTFWGGGASKKMDEIGALAQWKQANEAVLYDVIGKIDAKILTNFKEVHITGGAEIRDHLRSLLKCLSSSAHFEHGHINLRSPLSTIIPIFGARSPCRCGCDVRHYRNPAHGFQYLETVIKSDTSFCIRKMSI